MGSPAQVGGVLHRLADLPSLGAVEVTGEIRQPKPVGARDRGAIEIRPFGWVDYSVFLSLDFSPDAPPLVDQLRGRACAAA